MLRERVADAMSEKKSFRVIYEQDDGGWHVTIPSVKGCHTWGRSLGAARKNIREALGACSDVFKDPDKVAAAAVFDEVIRLTNDAREALAKARLAAAKRATVEKEAREYEARAAKILTANGLSLRDSGDILGMSQEQVRQLVKAMA